MKLAPTRRDGESVAGENGDSVGVPSHEVLQAAADFHRGVVVVSEGQNAAGRLTLGPDEIGDAVHQHPCLAGARAGQDEHVGLLAVVRHDALLDGIVQAADDGDVGLRGRLALDLPPAPGQPPFEKLALFQCEIIHRQPQGLTDRLQAALGKLHHDVNLQHLPLVVQRKGLEVRVGEAAPLRRQSDGHGGTEDRQAAVQADDLHVVQPQQGVVQEFRRVPDPAVEEHVALQGFEEPAHRGLGEQIGAAALRRQLAEQVVEKEPGGAAAELSRFLQVTPASLQGNPDGFGVPRSQAQTALAAAFAAAVLGDALEHPRTGAPAGARGRRRP